MTTYSRDAYLSRDTLSSTAFAIPERRAWPIHNERHARIAIRYMAEGKGDSRDYPRIRRAIRAKYPGLDMTARDMTVIITEKGGSSGKGARQRYNPAKRKKGKFVRKGFAKRMGAKYGDKASTLNTETQRDPGTSRDFADELRHLSVQALGRLLIKAARQGDEHKCSLIEREIDRRGRQRRR